MRLVAELAAGAAACGVAYYLALPADRPRPAVPPAVSRGVPSAGSADPRDEQWRPDRAAYRGGPARPVTVPGERAEAAPSLEHERAMANLRNAANGATARDMYLRGESVVACFGGDRPVGVQKLRFAVEVASTPTDAALGRWRFVEVVEGEPVPPGFPACAERAFGGGQRLVPPAGLQFPDHRGELSIVYTIPAPDGD
jgi:hypothetical protein